MGEALGLMYSATESFRLWHRTDFQQDVAEERQEEKREEKSCEPARRTKEKEESI